MFLLLFNSKLVPDKKGRTIRPLREMSGDCMACVCVPSVSVCLSVWVYVSLNSSDELGEEYTIESFLLFC